MSGSSTYDIGAVLAGKCLLLPRRLRCLDVEDVARTGSAADGRAEARLGKRTDRELIDFIRQRLA